MVVVTDPAYFGPGMLKLLGRKQLKQGMGSVGLGQVGFYGGSCASHFPFPFSRSTLLNIDTTS